MGQCCSKNAEAEQELVTPHQMPANNTVCTPILNGAAHPSQIKLQPATPSFYKPQNSSFQSQSHLNTSASSDGRKKDFGGSSNEDTVIALFPYESRSEGDLSFQKNDIMLLLESKDADWWFVRHTKDGRTGYVPRNFVALRKSLESEEWFAGNIQRSMAERLVLSSGTPIGTFLIRERDVQPKEYALTIKDKEGMASSCVKHYRIKQLDNNDGFFITSRMKFQTLKQLVRYYSDSADGLCTKLTIAAPRMAPTRQDLSSQTQNAWEIPRHELQLKEKLGSGNFGDVYKGLWRGKVLVAIKTLKPGTMSNEAFLGEAQIMKQCDHPNLVKLYAVCTKEEPFFIITEFMQNGSLLAYLRNETNTLNIRCLIDMASQIANGMMYLEERRLVHRDLAARNVLVGEKIAGVPIVKVADFGLARVVEEDVYEARLGAKFPIKWTALEAAISGNFTTKSDIWSFGILLFEIITRGQVPYAGMQNRQVLEEVEQGYRMPMPKSCPRELYDLMLKCWNVDPNKRPTFSYLYTYLDDFFIASQGAYLPPHVVFIQSSLMDELKNYRIQLQQVEAALIPNPENEELLKLREDLNEIIQLQESLLSEELADEKPTPQPNQPTSSLSSEKKISWKVGDRCLAPSKNGQHYIAVIDGISQDKVAITFASNGVKHMVKLHELRIAPVEEKKEYIFKTNKTANGANGPKKEWQLERERRKFRAQKKEQRRKQIDEAQEQQKNKWLNFNAKATTKSIKGLKRVEASGSAADGPRGSAHRDNVVVSSRVNNRYGGSSRNNMDSLF